VSRSPSFLDPEARTAGDEGDPTPWPCPSGGKALPVSSSPPMISLFDQSHTEARRLVKTGATVFLTVNPVEFHGPHLSLHNDRIISLGLAKDLHARLEPKAPLLLGADLEVGVDPCPGPGSRHTPYGVVRDLVVEACRALAELGVKRVVLMTFH
jgi:creatinine amidohydrolase